MERVSPWAILTRRIAVPPGTSEESIANLRGVDWRTISVGSWLDIGWGATAIPCATAGKVRLNARVVGPRGMPRRHNPPPWLIKIRLRVSEGLC